jgi:hypothetical protein
VENASELLVIAVVDALRADELLAYVQQPGSRLGDALRPSCVASTLYASSSNTVGSLRKLFQRPGGHGEIWLDTLKRAGVKTSLVMDRLLAAKLGEQLPTVFSRFERSVTVERTPTAGLAPLFPALLPLLREPGQQLIWAHFFDVHEWAKDNPSATRRLYADRVAEVGGQISDILESVAATKRRATVVVIADHGEGLDHYSTRFHGEFAYEPLVRIPFMVWVTGHPCPAALSVVNGAVPSATLLGRLFLDELGVPSSPELPTLRELALRPVMIQASLQDAVIRWPHKLIVSPWFVELFDVSVDPHEQHDLSDQSQTMVRELRELYDSEMAEL